MVKADGTHSYHSSLKGSTCQDPDCSQSTIKANIYRGVLAALASPQTEGTDCDGEKSATLAFEEEQVSLHFSHKV
jgi:hypothetical protein